MRKGQKSTVNWTPEMRQRARTCGMGPIGAKVGAGNDLWKALAGARKPEAPVRLRLTRLDVLSRSPENHLQS